MGEQREEAVPGLGRHHVVVLLLLLRAEANFVLAVQRVGVVPAGRQGAGAAEALGWLLAPVVAESLE